jgi:glycosyltransferase involved in cell wall biosynthesis
MHVVLVTVFPKDPQTIEGGVEGVSKYLADELSHRKGVKLSIVVPWSQTNENKVEDWEGYRVYRLAQKKPWSVLPTVLYNEIYGRRQIQNFIRSLNIDLIHYEGYLSWMAKSSIPSILTIHGIAELDALWSSKGICKYLKWFIYKLTEGLPRRTVSYLIAINKYVYDFMPSRNKIKKTWLIENPVAHSYFQREWNYEPGRIFNCAKVISRKNTLGLLKAFSQVVEKYPKANLRIGGGWDDSEYLNLCQEYVAKKKLKDKVVFLGNLSILEVQEELTKANCFVLPSFQETAPLAIEEAMAAGVPVVASRLCGIPHMIIEGETGFLIDPKKIETISSALLKILFSEKKARLMSLRAKEEALKRFRCDEVVEKTLKAYEEILDKSTL